jgi:hypothetical protein
MLYVDPLRCVNGVWWCHLFADDDFELEVAASMLGLRAQWKHDDHYDLTPRKREKAIAMGAREVTSRTLVEVRRGHRGRVRCDD